MSKWKSVLAKAYCESVRDGTHNTPKPVAIGGKPLVTSKHIKNGEVDFKSAYHISIEDFDKINERSCVDKWDVLMSMIGTVGECAVIKEEADYAIKNLALFKMGGDKSRALWLYYFLRSPMGQGQLRANYKGASQQFVSLTQLRNLEIPLPPLPVQRRIADVLSAYDDLIENNRRRIAILEETARLAYRKWFGGVEEGRTATLGEIADVVMGQSPESKTYNDNGEGLPFHQGVTGFGFRYPRNEMWCTAGTRFAEEGDILFSVRAPVGRINVAGERIVIGRGLSAMRAKNGFQSWLLYALKHHFSKEDMIGVGCIFASTTKKELLSVALPFPPDEEIAAFEQIAGPTDAQIKALSRQNAFLATARDILLPRLMKRDLMCLDMSDTDTTRCESRVQIPPFPNRGCVSDFGGAL